MILLDTQKLKRDITKVRKNLDVLKGDAQSASRKAIIDTTHKIQEVIEPRVPVVTGLLKSSFARYIKSDYFAEVGYNTDYAVKVNYFGKSKGYFTDPFNANQKNFTDFFEERFNNYYL